MSTTQVIAKAMNSEGNRVLPEEKRKRFQQILSVEAWLVRGDRKPMCRVYHID
jgi:hypothetical protein